MAYLKVVCWSEMTDNNKPQQNPLITKQKGKVIGIWKRTKDQEKGIGAKQSVIYISLLSCTVIHVL